MDKMGAEVSYIDLGDLHGADANSIPLCIKASGKSVYGDEFIPKLVGFGSDGASVNTGKKEGVIMMMKCFYGMIDRGRAFSLISSRDHYQRSSPSRISDTLRVGFKPAQNLSRGFVE